MHQIDSSYKVRYVGSHFDSFVKTPDIVDIVTQGKLDLVLVFTPIRVPQISCLEFNENYLMQWFNGCQNFFAMHDTPNVEKQSWQQSI
jgi:hypothetical protein